MNCDQCRRRLSADRDHGSVAEHLDSCAQCRAWATTLSGVRRAAPALLPAAPATLAADVLDRVGVSAPREAADDVVRTAPFGAARAPGSDRPPFWRPAARKFVASLAAASLVLAGLVVAMGSNEPDAEAVLVSAYEAVADGQTYRFSVEGEATAEFAPPDAGEPPVRALAPPGGTLLGLPDLPDLPPLPDLPALPSLPDLPDAPDMPAMPSGPGPQGPREYPIEAAQRVAAMQAQLRSVVQTHQAALRRAAEDHRDEYLAYTRELAAALGGFQAEFHASVEASFGQAIDYTPPELSVRYRAGGEAVGAQRATTRVDYGLAAPIAVSTSLEAVQDGDATYVRADAGDGGWLALGPDHEFSVSVFAEVRGLPDALALLRQAQGEIERLEDREIDGVRARGYRYRTGSGVEVEAWVSSSDNLPRMLRIWEDEHGRARRSMATTTVRLFDFGAEADVRAPGASVTATAQAEAGLPMGVRRR